MRVLDLAQKDLIQIIRDWKSALFLVIMPIMFTLFFGFVFGPDANSASEGDPRLPVGVINQDAGGVLSAHLVDLIDGSEAIRPLSLTDAGTAETVRRVERGELAAAVTIPAGYSQGTLAGEDNGLVVITDQTTAAGQIAVSALKTATDRLLGAVEAAQISAENYAGQVGFTSPAARQQFLQDGLDQAIAAWREPPLRVETQQATGAASTEEGSAITDPFAQSSPGMIVQFAVFGLTTSAMILVLERQSRALQRLLTTPIRPAQVIAGHVLAMFFVVFIQQVILIGVGQFAFGVDYLRVPLAILLVMAALALWTASLGLLIGALAKREEQVITLSLIAMFVFSALGGAWFPLEVTGQAFSTIGHLMPTAWAMDGFQNIVVRGQGLASALLPTGALLAYAVLFFSLAVWRFRFE